LPSEINPPSLASTKGVLISVCLLTQIVNKYRGLPAYIKKVPGILESKIMDP